MAADRKKIGIMGGTFDPVHTGHLLLAKCAVEEAGLGKVLFMPAYIQPFKADKKVGKNRHRIAMLELAAAEDPDFGLSLNEIRRAEISYTIRSLRRIRDELGEETEIFFISGADTFLNLEIWYEAEKLLTEFSFIAGARAGCRDKEVDEHRARLKRLYGTETIKINNYAFDISSTEIRERIRRGKSVRYLLPETVEAYIFANGLYR
ncbi:MAG: nicotinate-nucleotide adenylyltransferase [Clostridiales Family XIII bacterium]|jgi:nicotinate-nucleotide adenylyltransferase|nr:nicotinate-nucleotide adenylyltransferase [Clostridiales Family XIII bacterium]